MPLINRIEVSNFMNSRREDPWRPDWAYQVLDLKGYSTAINMPNGRGKSTIIHAVLAMLTQDKSLNDLRMRHFAPQSTGHFSHVRVETTIATEEGAPNDLIVQAGGGVGGAPIVFGMYGNSGENGTQRLYAYFGTLEDCPVGYKTGNRITLLGNAAFLEKFSAIPSRFPATQRDETRANWRDFVSGIFDLAGIEQQLVYQKAKGAEGSSGYFDVRPARGQSFSEAVFYERLAPELLADMMSGIEEYADERGIEDTIQQKVQGIIQAKAQTAKSAIDLEKTQRILDEFSRIQTKSVAVDEAAAKEGKVAAEFSMHYSVLQRLVMEDPLPGVLRMPQDDDPALARAMVMQGGRWFMPDRAFDLLTGESASAVNLRAEKHGVQTTAAEKSQVMDFASDSNNRQDRGQPSRLYSVESAVALLSATTHFKAPHTRETAMEAASEAFDWVGKNGDTNPARIEKHRLTGLKSACVARLGRAKERHAALVLEQDALKDEQQRMGVQQDAYRKMAESGLFTPHELSEPGRTGDQVKSEADRASAALMTHQRTVAEGKGDFADWQAFSTIHGGDGDPDDVIARLERYEQTAQQALDCNLRELTEARAAQSQAQEEASRQEGRRALIAEKSAKLAALKPLAAAFTARFGEERPDGLAAQVKVDLACAKDRLAQIAASRAVMEDGLACLRAFVKQYGDTSPTTWLTLRDQERIELAAEILKLDEMIHDLTARRKDLDRGVIAPGSVARQVRDLAGVDATPLYAAIEGFGLKTDRKAQVLSMFSALLFSPVYATSDRAALVAASLAEQGVESPVFVEDELARFCRNAEIAYDGKVARTWLVGVRTRPVDCLLDPTLVDREKANIEQQIAQTEKTRNEKRSRQLALVPEHPEAITARKAAEAIDKGYQGSDRALVDEAARIQERVPNLEDRACDDAIASIRAVVEYQGLLAGRSKHAIDEALAKIEEETAQAAKVFAECAERFQTIDGLRDGLHAALNIASVNAQEIPKLRKIKRFMDAGGVDLMNTAQARGVFLENAKRAAELRAGFAFADADLFVTSGEKRPQEIERRLTVIAPEIAKIQGELIPTAVQELARIDEGLLGLDAAISEIDNFVRTLRKKHRDMGVQGFRFEPITQEALAGHPLFRASIEVRQASASSDVAKALLGMRDPLEDIAAEALKHDLEDAKRSLKGARALLGTEIDRVRADTTLALSDQLRVGLERAKESRGELLRMIEATTISFNQSQVANETARRHLDEEWGQIGEWLGNFTRRLPSNFDAMRKAFRPGRDPVSGAIATAGFEIEARIADMKDVRRVLTGIVDRVERSEKTRDGLTDDEGMRARYDKDMRRQIREEFYRNVIVDPKIKICVPSISLKSLALEKNMLSSGQGVAMTLLWIVKMADYVTERELSRQSVSAAARKKLRAHRTQFVIIDGAFSHLSDKRLITDALDGVRKNRGSFQLVITGHDPNYKNDYAYFPTYIAAHEVGGNLMYADSQTKLLMEPEEVGSHYGAMELASWHRHPGVA
ncbi:MAG: hypothetical protein ACYDEV_11105 [Acidiferrobacter sp.]